MRFQASGSRFSGPMMAERLYRAAHAASAHHNNLMSDSAAFLAAIREAPEDDAPRLIYADWLDEYDQPERAEFIRLQCSLARKARFDPGRLPLEKREQEILAKHAADWSRPVSAIARDLEYHRGFVDSVAVGARKFLTHGAELFALEPIRHVKLFRLGSSQVSAADLVKCDLLPRIRGLTLQGNLEANELRILIKAPGLRQLTALSLEGTHRGEGLEPLLAGCLPKLESLVLDAEMPILSIAQVEKLAKAKWASSLKHLDLQYHNLKVGGVQALAASRCLRGLTSLNLKHCSAGLGGTQALAETSNLPNLTTLDLRSNRLTDSAAQAIAASTKLPALTELFLGMNEIGPEGVIALAKWPGLARLRFLHLYSNAIGDEGACALAASPHVANLWCLDVTETGIGPKGSQALAESPYLKNTRIGSWRWEFARV
jgi:uncharacterized protein (TIGR02996 family)